MPIERHAASIFTSSITASPAQPSAPIAAALLALAIRLAAAVELIADLARRAAAASTAAAVVAALLVGAVRLTARSGRGADFGAAAFATTPAAAVGPALASITLWLALLVVEGATDDGRWQSKRQTHQRGEELGWVAAMLHLVLRLPRLATGSDPMRRATKAQSHPNPAASVEPARTRCTEVRLPNQDLG